MQPSQISETASQALEANAEALYAESEWLSQLIIFRNKSVGFSQGQSSLAENETLFTGFQKLKAYPPPKIEKPDSFFRSFLLESQLNFEERLLLILVLVNHFRPGLLAGLFGNEFTPSSTKRSYGGIQGVNFPYFIPTGQTYLYLLCGDNLADRLMATQLFIKEHLFAREGILFLEPHLKGEPSMSGRLMMAEAFVELFTLGRTANSTLNMKYFQVADHSEPT